MKELALQVSPTQDVHTSEYSKAIASSYASISHAITVKTASTICYYVEKVKQVTGSAAFTNTALPVAAASAQ